LRAIDTNVVARFLLADDLKQYEIALTIIRDGVFVPTTVLLELGWLLESRYRQSRTIVAKALQELIDLPTVTIEDASWVSWAIERYAAGADFPDMVHLVGSRFAETFSTFDAGIRNKAGSNAPLPIETLA
jgi:predicted nucleic-acid-binding protein